MTRFAILLGLIVSITSLDANAKCRWRVKGRLVTTNNQPMANKKVKIRARYNKPRGLWNDGNWYDTKTDAQGNFKSHSKPFLLDCRFRRDVRLELRVNKKNVEIARKNRARKGTINFGTVRVNESALVTKAGCRRVTIDARVTIAGKNAAQGIRIRFRHSKISGNHLRTWNFSTPLETRVDASGRVKGSYIDCSRSARKKQNHIYVAYRAEFHAKSLKLTMTNNALRSNIAFSKGYIRPRSTPTVKFRMPVENPKIIHSPGLIGPHGVDHGPWAKPNKQPHDKWKGASCTNYRGKKGFPKCYRGHKGTDYMLKGGFLTMGKKSNWVVAAANGRIIGYQDGYFDGCTPLHFKSHTECGPTTIGANHVVIKHDNGIESRYWHFKKGSVVAALRKLGVPENKLRLRGKPVVLNVPVKCGARIGRIGSSGYSSGPHLHFEVRHDNKPVDPYKGRLSDHSYWVHQGGPKALPAARCQGQKKTVWVGTAPFCRGRSSDCTKRGMKAVRFDKRGDGKRCATGRKVLCSTH